MEVLAAPDDSRFNWSTHPLLGLWPDAASWLNTLPATALFISLLAMAVLLQGLQSLSRLANNVSVGTFAAECRARVTARIHSQVLRLSFPCASAYKLGDLTDDASQGPETIRIQIERSGQLLVLLLALALMGGLITLLQKQLLHADGASSYGGEPGLASP